MTAQEEGQQQQRVVGGGKSGGGRKWLQSVSLYSPECLDLLQQALEVATATAADAASSGKKSTTSAVFQSRYADSSSEEEGGANGFDEDASSSSSSSSPSSQDEEDDDSEKEDKEDTKDKTTPKDDSDIPGLQVNLEQASLQDAAAAAALKATKTKKRRHKPTKMELDQKQRVILIQKHVDTVPVVKLDLGSSTTATEQQQQQQLELPLALLSKEDRFHASSLVDMSLQSPHLVQTLCQSYLDLANQLSGNDSRLPVVVLFLRSGRFAGAVFFGETCLVHRTCQRYTTRKGQGKAQSSQDSQRRAKSMGAQLRRAGEVSLQQDVTETLRAWHQPYLQNASLILLSCPKTMKKGLFQDVKDILRRDDARIRPVPLDLGRPTFDTVQLIYSVLMTVSVREKQQPQSTASRIGNEGERNDAVAATKPNKEANQQEKETQMPSPTKSMVPLTALHVAAKNGDLEVLQDILESPQQQQEGQEKVMDWIDRGAGEDAMTPLHYAAQSTTPTIPTSITTTKPVDPDVAAECVSLLLLQGGANPCMVDARMRPPYFCATHDKVRQAFRRARAILGEDAWNWDEGAKVGPALTDQDLQERKDKEAEKKRKKRARQKEKKAKEKAHTEEMERQHREQEQQRAQEEEAKRIRDQLAPKPAAAGGNVCDFCQTVCRGKRRNQMFKRLDYVYCSTECVQKHKRELMAAAAMARFGNGSGNGG